MRYIQGRTLFEIIELLKSSCEETHKEFTWTRRVQIIQQICDAIDFAHSKGIVHCDLKPANIMIGSFGELIVMDWGVAVLADKTISKNNPKITAPQSPELTDTIMGTPSYISPESCRNNNVTYSRDIFAIGVIMYELLSLNQPFRRKTVEDTISAINNYKPKALYDFDNEGQNTIPVELHHICFKAIRKDPQSRYQSCGELKSDLQLYLSGRFPMKCPSTALKRMSLSLSHFIDDHPKKSVIMALLISFSISLLIIFLAIT